MYMSDRNDKYKELTDAIEKNNEVEIYATHEEESYKVDITLNKDAEVNSNLVSVEVTVTCEYNIYHFESGNVNGSLDETYLTSEETIQRVLQHLRQPPINKLE